MNPNKCSPGPADEPPSGLAALVAVVDDLAAQDLDGLADGGCS
jgi:hypothetical protein